MHLNYRVARYDTKTGLVQVNDDAYLRGLMQEKETSVYNTAWFVSNCGNSPGAKKRMDFAKDLIKAELRLGTLIFGIFCATLYSMEEKLFSTYLHFTLYGIFEPY